MSYAVTGQDVSRTTAFSYTTSNGGGGGSSFIDIPYSGIGHLELDGSSVGARFDITGGPDDTLLKGGTGNDVFNVTTIGAWRADGGGGTNSLDYSAFNGNVVVDLPRGIATGFGGGVRNIQSWFARATPQVSVNPVNFTYGTTFANSQLSGSATATVNGQTVNVPGTFTYTDASLIGSARGAGQYAGIGVTFTPNDTTHFRTAQATVTVTVAQATPQVSVNPVTIPAGAPLANSQLSGTATATVGGALSNVAGVFTYATAAGTVLGAGQGQTEQVTFTPADTIDFSTVQTTVTVNVIAGATPQLSLNPVNIGYGQPLANSQLNGTATVMVAGQSVNVAGSFAYTTAAGAILSAGQGQTESITFTPTNTTDFTTAQGTVTVNVSQATPQVSVNPVNFVYGTVLDNSQLTGTVTATVNGQTVNVAGTFTYTSPTLIGGVLGAGQFSGIGVTFTPNDATDFTTVQSNVTVTVVPAKPQVSVNPVTISLGTALDNSQLSGSAKATVGGIWSSIAGAFTYTTAAGTVLPAGQGQTEQATFTPADNIDFVAVPTTVTINVIVPTTPELSINPVNIVYGQPLADSQLSGTATAVVNGQQVNVAGTFTYRTADGTILSAGEGQVESVTFTPTDTTDFTTAQGSVTVIVAPAAPQVSVNPVSFVYGTVLDNSQLSGTATAMVNGQTVNVAGTFTYTDPAQIGGVLGAGQYQGINVTFTPTDTTDFASVQTSVTVTVAKATPQVSVNQVIIYYGTPLDNSQLSGTATVIVGGVVSNVAGAGGGSGFTYTSDAGTVLNIGTYTIAVTFTPADSTDFNTVDTFVQVIVYVTN
jgi:hypothetical protein